MQQQTVHKKQDHYAATSSKQKNKTIMQQQAVNNEQNHHAVSNNKQKGEKQQ